MISPLENKEPRIWLSVLLVSLINKFAVFEGRVISTVSFLAILKELKLMMALLEAVMFIVDAFADVKVAMPFSTLAPCGWAKTMDKNNKLITEKNVKSLKNFWDLVFSTRCLLACLLA